MRVERLWGRQAQAFSAAALPLYRTIRSFGRPRRLLRWRLRGEVPALARRAEIVAGRALLASRGIASSDVAEGDFRLQLGTETDLRTALHVGESEDQITALGWLTSRPARGSPLKRTCPRAAFKGPDASNRTRQAPACRGRGIKRLGDPRYVDTIGRTQMTIERRLGPRRVHPSLVTTAFLPGWAPSLLVSAGSLGRGVDVGDTPGFADEPRRRWRARGDPGVAPFVVRTGVN